MRWIWFELPHLSLHNAHKLILVATFQTLLTPLFIAFFFFAQTMKTYQESHSIFCGESWD